MDMTLERMWCMPNSETFQMRPIADLIERVLSMYPTDAVVIDPFARGASYGSITNDLDTSFETDYHMDALEFLRMLDASSADVILYDPPYSPRQASECYRAVGRGKLTGSVTNCGYWARCKDEVARVLKVGGRVLSFGWNSNGVGMKRGCEIEHVLMLAHGGAHNDTIATLEVKTSDGALR